MLADERLNQDIINCERCSRLRQFCVTVAGAKRRAFADWDYWGRPVPNFGDLPAGLLIVGLAPAAHGANRTGRMFTGDRSGEWLYRALHKAGFANQAGSQSPGDGLKLLDCAITAVCHCAPPDNKPTRDEMLACREWLSKTVQLAHANVFVTLGQIAWNQTFDVLRANGCWTKARPAFGHGREVVLAQHRWVIGSYHPSQQNTFTGRLTEPMFDDVFALARRRLDQLEHVQRGKP